MEGSKLVDWGAWGVNWGVSGQFQLPSPRSALSTFDVFCDNLIRFGGVPG